MTEKRAILIVSLGERPWFPGVRVLLEAYAAKCHADLIVETQYPSAEEFSLEEGPENVGRPNKRAYACKTYYTWFHLKFSGYDRILTMDDTCCVALSAPDIFGIVPAHALGYAQTGRADAERSFSDIRDFIAQRKIPEISYDYEHYANSGVLVYAVGMQDHIAPEKIVDCAPLLNSRFPHQSLSYYLFRRGNFPMFPVSKKFNTVPAVDLPKSDRRDLMDIRSYLNDDIHIYHVTGMYRNRHVIVPQVVAFMRGL